MAPECNNKDACALRVFELACAMRAGRISAGANISYRQGFAKKSYLFVIGTYLGYTLGRMLSVLSCSKESTIVSTCALCGFLDRPLSVLSSLSKASIAVFIRVSL
jgi:hypothetical protein